MKLSGWLRLWLVFSVLETRDSAYYLRRLPLQIIGKMKGLNLSLYRFCSNFLEQ